MEISTMRDQAPNPNTLLDDQSETAGRDVQSSARRRWILRSGITVAPVILTLASRPVLGNGLGPNGCISPSATLSGALSQATNQVGTCSGDGYSAWKSLATAPIPPDWASTEFHPLFSSDGGVGRKFYSANVPLKFGEILQLNGTMAGQDAAGNFDQDLVAGHMIAAYLNLTQKPSSISDKAMTVVRLLKLWREWALTGQYLPYAGATPWNGAAIVDYLTRSHLA